MASFRTWAVLASEGPVTAIDLDFSAESCNTLASCLAIALGPFAFELAMKVAWQSARLTVRERAGMVRA